MKRTFKVELRKTITQTQWVTIQAADEENAKEMALNHVDIGAWEYDSDSIAAIEAEEIEDAP